MRLCTKICYFAINFILAVKYLLKYKGVYFMKGCIKKKGNKNIFLFVDPVAGVLANGNRTIETVTKRCQPKITRLKVPVQHVLDVHITTKFIQPNTKE